MEEANLAAAFASFDGRWSPRVAAEPNGQHVELAKLEGPFVWHRHDGENGTARTGRRERDGENGPCLLKGL